MSSLDTNAFKRVELQDKELIQNFVFKEQRRSCELNFCNMFNWSPTYNYQWQIHEDRLIVILDQGDEILFPAGEWFSPDELAELSDAIRKTGHRGRIFDVPEEYFEKHDDKLQKHFGIIHSQASWDYVYSTEKLSALSGKKLRKKRNHISQFERNYTNWKACEITIDNVEDCERFIAEIHPETDPDDEDYLAISTALKFLDQTGLEGLALYIDDKVVAMALFSRQTEDTYTVHFEKTNKDFIGSSQMINRETANFLSGRCQYLNREQDLGIDGLRHAKRSYDPEFMIKRVQLDRHIQ